MARHGQASEAHVSAALRALGFDQERCRGHDADLIARKGREAFAVLVKPFSTFRADAVGGVLADGVLRVQRYARGRRMRPVVALVVPDASQARAAVAKYMAQYAPRMGWLLLDGRGGRYWHPYGAPGPAHAGASSKKAGARARPKRDLFSPGFQWLMKLVLMSGASPRYWGGPSQLPESLTALARAGAASQPYASMFHTACVELGLARLVQSQWSVSDPLTLLDQWASAVRGKDHRLYVRPLWPNGEDLLAPVEKKLRRTTLRYALGSLASCRLLGLERSNARHVRLYVEDVDVAMKEFELVAEGEPTSLELVRPRALASVLSPRVKVNGLWSVDALQAYLDVRFLAARGAEQARFVYDKVLLPHFKMRSWA